MKEKTKELSKVNTGVFFSPFLQGFNVKKIVMEGEEKESVELISPALKLIEKVSFDDETTSETVIRVIENYLLLISLAKVYQRLFYDAIQEKSFHRLEKLHPFWIKKYGGYNTHFMEELDQLISKELGIVKWKKVKVKVKEPENKIPVVSNEIILPTLENISYENVLERMVQEEVLPPEFIKNLTPKNEYGLLAVTIYRGTMQLIEAELRKIIETERLKIPPESLDEFFSRMTKYASEMG